MKKIKLLCAIGATALTWIAPLHAYAQAYPSKSIKWIVPYPVGGGSDMTARLIANSMSKSLGQPIVIDNKPGAGTQIGAQAVATSAPDGYTIGSADSGTLAFNPAMYKKLPYDTSKSFSYVGGFARMPFVLATKPDYPVNSLNDFITKVSKADSNLSYASAGAGSPHHVSMEMFLQRTKLKINHIPYKGGAPALQDLLSGQVDVMMLDVPGGMSMMKAGKVNLVAVAMPKRLAQFPNVPTMAEAGLPNFVAFAWQGLIAPAGTPQDVTTKLQTELLKALQDPEVRRKLEESGIEPMPMDSSEFSSYVKQEQARWTPIIKAAAISLD